MALTQISTNGIKDSNVTSADIADQAVTLDKLPHGTSSNNGKFLRANNGADPSFETVSIPAGTTINNNADNRVITGSGTANTLNGESLVTIDSNGRLSVSPSTGGSGITLASGGSTFGGVVKLQNTQGSTHEWQLAVGGGDNAYVLGRGFFIRDETTGANRLNINTNGRVGINEINPQQLLHVHNDTAYQGILINGNGAPRVGFARSTTTTGEWSVGIDGTNGNDFAITNSNDNSNRKLIISSAATTASGALVAGGSCTAYDNFIVGTAGKGLSFAVTSDASGMSSEVLDDYEEGTFTPSNATVGLSSANGRYTKIGNVVHFNLRAVFNNNGSAVAGYIEGLPYTSAANWSGSYPHSLTIGYATGNHIQFALLSGGSDRIYLYDKNGATVASTHFDNDDIRIGGSYQVA